MIEEGLLSEKKAASGTGPLVRLTARGNKYRVYLVKEQRALNEKIQRTMSPVEIKNLIRILKLIVRSEL